MSPLAMKMFLTFPMATCRCILAMDPLSPPRILTILVAESPPPQSPRTDSKHAQNVGDDEFLPRHQAPALATPGFVVVTHA